MTVAEDRQTGGPQFTIEEMWIGDFSTRVVASGFGYLGDGRSFAFRTDHRSLLVEIYRPRLAGPVPQAEEVVATSHRSVVDVDVADERSLAAAVRDAVATAEPVSR